jgi:hypothetical protein
LGSGATDLGASGVDDASGYGRLDAITASPPSITVT